MSLLNKLESIGKKVTGFFGDNSSYEEFIPLEKLFSGEPLSKFLPYRAYHPSTGLFINENSFGFILECLPIIGGDHTTQKEVTNIFLETMEEGSSLQCLLWADPRVDPFLNNWKMARKKQGEIFETLAEKRAEFTKKSKNFAPRIFRTILSYSMPFDGELKDSDFEKMQEVKNQILKSIGTFTQVYEWNAELFLNRLDGLVNYRPDFPTKNKKWSQFDFLSDQIPSGGARITVNEDNLKMTYEDKETLFSSYRVSEYPETWTLNSMQKLIGDFFRESFQIKVPFLIQYAVHCPNQDKQISRFSKKMQLIENQGKSGALLRWIPELAEELREYNSVRHAIKDGDKFMLTQMTAAIWAPKEKFIEEEGSLKSIFRINHFTLEACKYIHMPQFYSFLPMTWSEHVEGFHKHGLLKTSLASECGTFIPLQGEWMGTGTPGTFLVGRRGQVINWNPFDNNTGNYNTVVVGRSGSGKSVFMQDMLVNALGTGARIFVLEVGRSFAKMADLVGGQSIEFSAESNLCLNPFTLISDNLEEQEQSFSMLKAVVSTMASPTKGTDDYENALIERAINFAWKSKKNSASISDIAGWLSKQKDERAKQIGIMLTPYTKEGIYSKYFEGKNNVDFTSYMVLIELEELKEKKDLQSVVLQLFIMTITNITFLGDRKTPFYICIDEAWDLLRGKQTGVFIETLARRLRKYNGSLVIGTQSAEDFDATPGAKAALENSDWMCLLAQKNSSIQSLESSGKIQMDSFKKNVLESVGTRHGEYSEVFISDAQGGYAVGRLYLDPFSGLLYSTKADEYSKIKSLKEKGLSLVQAIETVLEEKNA